MIYYLFVEFLIIIGFSIKNEKKNDYLKFLMVVLFLFTALHNCYINGTDTISYRRFFNNSTPVLWNFTSYSHQFEIGYALLNSVVKTFINDYFAFQIVYCAISTTLLWFVIEKTGLEDNEKLLFLFVYFCFRFFQNSMEFLRQNIATLLIWIAILSINDLYQKNDEHNKTKYVYAVGSWLFHRSSIFNVVVFAVLEKWKRVNKKNILIITCILSAISLLLSVTYLNYIIDFGLRIGGQRYEKYIIDGDSTIRGINFINYALRWFFFLLYFFAIDNDKYEKKRVVLAVSSIAIICGSLDVEIFTRLLEYYMIGIYISIVKSQYLFTNKNRFIYKIFIFFVFTIILIRNLHTVSGGTYMNYELYPLLK